MRLVRKDINAREGTGSVTLMPQEPEDMWHLYNLVRPRDRLRAPAIRKVKTTAATGSTTSNTVRTTLTIKVVSTDFDPAAGALHVAGRVCEENQYVPIGSHHTLDLELHRQFTLFKGEEDVEGESEGGWDSVALEILKQATDVKSKAQTYAVVMQEGLANICIITEFQTILRQRVEVSIPKKRSGAGAEAHEKGLDRFFDTVLTNLLRIMDIPAMVAEGKSQPLLLASPGFTAQEFQRFILDLAQRNNDKTLASYARESILMAHTSSGHVHALNEALKQPSVLAKLADTRFFRDTQILEKFFELVRKDEGWAWYGPTEVERAVDKGAVGRGGGVLLISDKLFRSQNIAVRKRWVSLVERVRQAEGGEVRILSSAHESGKRLESLGNIGAILTFPLLDLDEQEGEEEDNEPMDEISGGEDRDLNGGEGLNGQDHDRIAEDMGF